MWYLLKSSVRQGENHRTWKGPATSVENSSKRKRKSRLKWNFFGLEDSLNSSWGPRRKEWRAQGKFFIALICDCSSARVTTIRFQLTPTCELHCPEIDSLSSATIYPWNLPKFFFWGFLKVDREVWSSRVSHHIFLTTILSSTHNLWGWGDRFQFDCFSLFNQQSIMADREQSWIALMKEKGCLWMTSGTFTDCRSARLRSLSVGFHLVWISDSCACYMHSTENQNRCWSLSILPNMFEQDVTKNC